MSEKKVKKMYLFDKSGNVYLRNKDGTKMVFTEKEAKEMIEGPYGGNYPKFRMEEI